MMKCIKKITFFLLTWMVIVDCFAAKDRLKPDEEYNFYKTKYPDKATVYSLKKQTVDFSCINDSIVTKINVYEEIFHLGDNTVRYATDKVFSSSFVEISNLKAYTLIPEKKKYTQLDVAEFKTSYDKNSSVFFDDSKEISFTFPSIQKGAKTVLEYTKTIKDPRMMHMFFFDTYIPVDHTIYTVEYDNRITINPQFFNADQLSIQSEKSNISDSRSSVSFKASDVDEIKFERDCPSYKTLAATLYCSVSYFINNVGDTIYLNSSLDKLHEWYRTFVKDILDKDESLNELVNSIVGTEEDPLEKVRKIYYWVQENVKYIAFEDGMRGFVPHPGSHVIDKRYGDCKDMASAIVSMLREINIEANYTWVGTRDLPYKYTVLPDPVTDNHMIASFVHNGRTYYLDATGQYTPLGLPTSMIQGKECLISLGEKKYEIKEVPVIPKEVNIMTDSVSISIEKGKVSGIGQATLSGYAKVFNSYKLVKASQKSIDDYVKRLLTKGSNKFHLDNYSLSNITDRDKPILINYDFNISDYYRQIGDNIYINPVLDKTMTDAILENRSVPIENEYKYINRNIVKLTIPDGFQLNSVPENIIKSNDNFGYSITYQSSASEVIVTKEFYLDYLVMDSDQFESWNTIILEYAKACRKAIILSKN